MFVAEIMPEAEKEKLPFPVYTYDDGTKPTLWKWVVDREQDAYMVLVNVEGGGYEGTPLTKHYILNWNNRLIRVSADPMGATFNESGATMHWIVHSVDVLKGLITDQDELNRVIQHAFRAVGELFDGEEYFSVAAVFEIRQKQTYVYQFH